jgi:hypothetical protein
MVLSNPGYYDDVACENEKYQIVQKAAFAYDCFMGRDIAQFWDSLNDLFYGSDGQEPEAQASLIRKMQEACLSVGGKYYGEWELDPWIVLGELELIEKREPIAFLIDNKIPAMVSCFNDAYPHSQLLQDEEQKEEFVGWLNSYLQWQPEGYRFAQDALRIIKAYEKQAQREQKRAEKEMRIEAGKSRFPLSFAPRSKRGQHESMPSDYDDQPW